MGHKPGPPEVSVSQETASQHPRSHMIGLQMTTPCLIYDHWTSRSLATGQLSPVPGWGPQHSPQGRNPGTLRLNDPPPSSSDC